MTFEPIEIGPLDRRRPCECCGFPTLLVPDEYEPDPRWDLTSVSCILCEWESRPLDQDGDVRTDVPSDEERNDGLSLEVARSHFARFLSIYNPDEPPIWKVAPAIAEVLDARDALRAVYEEVLALDIPDRYERWEDVRGREYALHDALTVQRSRDEDFGLRE